MREIRVNKHISQLLQKNMKIFQLQVFNQQNKPKITPLYTGFEELKLQCQKILQSQSQIRKNNHALSSQQFHPIVWVDYQNQSNHTYNQFSQQEENNSLFEQFQQILINSQDSQRNTDSQKEFKIHSQKGKSLKESLSQLKHKNNSLFKQSLNEKLFITAKHLNVKVSQENNTKMQDMNIILIHLTLFTNQKEFRKISDTLLSLGIYLSDQMIINIKGTKDQKKQLQKLSQCLGDKVREIKKCGESKSKYHIDMISFQQVDLQNEKNGSLIKHHRVKSKDPIKSLVKLKNEIIQRLDLRSYNKSSKNEGSLKSFMERLEIASRIVSSTIKKSYFERGNLFSQEKISEKEREVMKEVDLGEQRLIREKFQSFYNDLRFNSRKQLPLHGSVIKFKVDEFVRLELKDNVRNKKLLEKVSSEYRIKISEQNDKEIKKIVQTSVKDYLTSKSVNTQVKEEIRYHPEKVSKQIEEYHHIIQQSYLFVTEEVFNSIAYPKIYNHYYQTLYEEYKRVKRENEQSYEFNQQQTFSMRKELQGNKVGIKQLQEKYGRQRHKNYQLRESLDQMKLEKQRVQDQLIGWKQQANDTKKLLMNQQSIGDKLRDQIGRLQERVKELEAVKVENILGVSNKGELLGVNNKNDLGLSNKNDLGLSNRSELLQLSNKGELLQLSKGESIQMGRQLVNMQQVINKQTEQSLSLTQQFQIQLNKYKGQYSKLGKQLKEKQEYLKEKQQYYKHKIQLLQSQLHIKNNHSIQNTTLTKQNNTITQQSIRQDIQKQFKSKIEQIQHENENKMNNYQQQIKQLQSIIHSNNQNITYLNEQIYTLKKTIHSHQQTIHNNANTITKLSKQLHNQTKSIQNKDLIIDKKQHFISQLTQQNILLNSKINQLSKKHSNIQSKIQSNIQTLTNKGNQQQFHNLQSLSILNQNNIKSNSFLRFQTDNDPTILDQSASINDITTKSIYSNNATPLKRSSSRSRVKTVTEIKQNIELQKLIQQRKTIQKRKQKCSQRQIILQDLHKNNSLLVNSTIKQTSLLTNSIIKQTSLLQQPFFSTQSTIFNKQENKNMITRQQKNLCFKNEKQNNKVFKDSSMSSKHDGFNNQREQNLRKRLF